MLSDFVTLLCCNILTYCLRLQLYPLKLYLSQKESIIKLSFDPTITLLSHFSIILVTLVILYHERTTNKKRCNVNYCILILKRVHQMGKDYYLVNGDLLCSSTLQKQLISYLYVCLIILVVIMGLLHCFNDQCVFTVHEQH